MPPKARASSAAAFGASATSSPAKPSTREPGRGEVLVGEVSMVNDDENDNCFLDGVIRFDPVEEDEPPEWIPAADYRKFVTEADHA